MPLGPAFQAPFAEAVRREAKMPTMSVGFIWEAQAADRIVRDGQADLVALAREVLYNPNWPLHAARELGVDNAFAMWKPQFGWWLNKRQRAFDRLGIGDPAPLPSQRSA